MSAQHTPGRLAAFDNAGPAMQSYSQSSGLHGTSDGCLKIICGCFNDIGGDDVASANAARLAACWNACVGFDTELLLNIVLMGDTLKQRFDGMQAEVRRVDAKLAMARSALATATAEDGL